MNPSDDSLNVYSCRFDSLPDAVVYEFVEVEPSYPGGEIAMINFIRENMIYPEAAYEMGPLMTSYVSFIVDTTGYLTCLGIHKKSPDQYNPLDLEVLRVINLMPPWTPGTSQGTIVPVSYIIPVHVHPAKQ